MRYYIVFNKSWSSAGNFFLFNSIYFLALLTYAEAEGSLDSLLSNASFITFKSLLHSAYTFGCFCDVFEFLASYSLNWCSSFYKAALVLVKLEIWLILSFSAFPAWDWSRIFLLNIYNMFNVACKNFDNVGSIFFFTLSNFLCLFTSIPIF